MSEHPIGRAVRRFAGDPAESDLALLDRWVTDRDQSAFELLVWRHGGMVLAACRRALPPDDAADAFQATFLVLVHKAGSVGRRGALGGWLHRVAVRVSRAARRKAAGRLRPLAEEPPAPPADEATDRDLRAVLDEELDRLPDRLRRVLVLCYLQGKTADEAARELGCPRGTVLSRLLRGREKLKGRLVRRGVAPAAAAVLESAGGAAGGPPAQLVGVVLDVAAGGLGAVRAAPGPAAGLAREVVNAMWMKTVWTGAALLAAVGVGLGVSWGSAAPQEAPRAVPRGVRILPPAAPAAEPAVPVASQTAPAKAPVGPVGPAGGPVGPARAPVGPSTKAGLKVGAEKLKGEWSIARMEMGGEKLPDGVAARMGFTFGAEKLTIKGKLAAAGGQYVVRAGSEDFPFKVDAAKKVAEIDVEVKAGEFAKGIYRFDGGDLILCIDYARAERPTAFETEGHPAHALYRLTRPK
jgi:RNA polymerase sigma factor (sigma-70 family)